MARSELEICNEMKASVRYPYTYACDWVRDAGLAESRADASKWITQLADYEQNSNEYVARRLADLYISYQIPIVKAEEMKKACHEHLKHMNSLMEKNK